MSSDNVIVKCLNLKYRCLLGRQINIGSAADVYRTEAYRRLGLVWFSPTWTRDNVCIFPTFRIHFALSVFECV